MSEYFLVFNNLSIAVSIASDISTSILSISEILNCLNSSGVMKSISPFGSFTSYSPPKVCDNTVILGPTINLFPSFLIGSDKEYSSPTFNFLSVIVFFFFPSSCSTVTGTSSDSANSKDEGIMKLSGLDLIASYSSIKSFLSIDNLIKSANSCFNPTLTSDKTGKSLIFNSLICLTASVVASLFGLLLVIILSKMSAVTMPFLIKLSLT